MDELNAFLARHEPIREETAFSPGLLLDDWRILAFIGKGGSGEVYQVENIKTGQIAAAKVLVRTDETAWTRFRLECRLLSEIGTPAFPAYLGQGECSGKPYLVVELLDRGPLPRTDAAVADYLLPICAGVRQLHARGYVHRDIKPENVLFRENGEPVLIDLGLVKAWTGEGRVDDSSLSIVDGKPVGVGTPKFAAPEQFMGGEVSPLSDVHALGMLANACFDGNPPRIWRGIIRKATNTIPSNRYASVGDFERAIRHRWTGSIVAGAAALFGAIGLAVAFGFLWWRGSGHEAFAWRGLQTNLRTNVVEEVLLWERPVTKTFGGQSVVASERAFRYATNEVRATCVRLNGRDYRFERPIALDKGEWWIEGPGFLDAEITGQEGVMIRIRNALVVNRTTAPLSADAVRYELREGACLDFPNLQGSRQSEAILPYDGAKGLLLFGVPADKRALLSMWEDRNRILEE